MRLSLLHSRTSDNGHRTSKLETIEKPFCIYEGNMGAYIAVSVKQEETDKFIAVIYKEIELTDGFVITAFLSNKRLEFEKKKIIWKQ